MKKIRYVIASILTVSVFVTGCSSTNNSQNKNADKNTNGENETVINGDTNGDTNYVQWNTGESSGEISGNETVTGIDSYVTTTNGVTTSMLNAAFWTNKCDIGNNILMNDADIVEYNKSNMTANKYVFGDTVPKEELISLINEEDGPTGTTYVNGTAVSPEYYDDARNNRNISAIVDTNPVLYGICVNRSEMKCLPTDIRAYSNNIDYFRDLNVNSAILLGDPVKILHTSLDDKWYFIQTEYTAGWIAKENIALCSDMSQWEEWQQGDFLIVTGDKFDLEEDYSDGSISKLEVSMGTKLALIGGSDYIKNGETRVVMNNYVVKIPARNSDGSIYAKYGFIPFSRDVCIGYMPYTRNNVIELAMKSIGDRYGWGGMYDSRDCSSLIMDIYRCFGIVLPRNSSEQAVVQTNQNVSGMSGEEKISAIKNAGMGALLYFKGHIMIYLGESNGELYVISAVGNLQENIGGNNTTINVNSVIINTLSTMRGQNSSWINDIERIVLVSRM